MHKGRTKDEKFLICLYKILEKKADFSLEIEIAHILKMVSQKENEGKTIVRDLAQANFIIKSGDKKIKITPRGIEFALNELSS
jgi:predicted transcriptional regulator